MDKRYEVYGEWIVGGSPTNGGYIDGFGVDCDSLDEVNDAIREMVMIVDNGNYVWLQTPEVTIL